jgi:hypothetical protein
MVPTMLKHKAAAEGGHPSGLEWAPPDGVGPRMSSKINPLHYKYHESLRIG